ncbi:DJ-1/PfpI family protein [Spirillospora sp. CA-294931]|uniref:DJ-1/PfpI family protein n=1 Tax=Spirillospora sp. CA-294931 TaxID=3240042 RepID=UPI003D8A74E4
MLFPMNPMNVAFVLYDQMTALDLTGPYEFLATQPEVTPHFVAERTGPVQCDAGLVMQATSTFADLPAPDLVVVPGSGHWKAAAEANDALLDWLAAAASGGALVTSVCTGSTLLAKAGLLAGRRATTHWIARDLLAELGAVVSADRVVDEGDVITAAGVSAGLDMALAVVARLWGDDRARLIQLIMEYDPQPPFDAGSLTKAPAELAELARHLLTAPD